MGDEAFSHQPIMNLAVFFFQTTIHQPPTMFHNDNSNKNSIINTGSTATRQRRGMEAAGTMMKGLKMWTCIHISNPFML
jgi:hypothetical protein